MLIVEVLRCPHLMLAHTGTDNGFTLRDPVQTFQDVVRLNEIAAPVVIERMILFQLGNVHCPWRKIFLEAARKVQEILKTVTRIGDM